MVFKYGVNLTSALVLCIATTKANLPQLFAPQSIVMHVGINPNVLRTIINSSSEFVAKYHI